MADEFITIRLKGAERIIAALKKFPDAIRKAMTGAGREAASGILRTEGLKRYPPATAANVPPTQYYIRGRGTQYKSRNLGNSERLGTQFYIDPRSYNTAVGNRASYAEYVVGEKQAKAMGRIGWRKLGDVARERIAQITETFQKWTDRTLKELGL